MRKSVVFFALLCLAVQNGYGLDEQYCEKVQGFIDAVRSGDQLAVADFISFPLGREYPIPPIHNREEFVARYDEVFDEELIEFISNSDTDNDWHLHGWQGIMCNGGLIWMRELGNVFVINYQSEAEKAILEGCIDLERNELHSSLQEYEAAISRWKTQNYMIRIDKLADGAFRYAVWPANAQQTDEPDLILTNGEVFYSGSAGNHHYEFRNDIYTYKCKVSNVGSDESIGVWLVVLMNDEEILREKVTDYLNPDFWTEDVTVELMNEYLRTL